MSRSNTALLLVVILLAACSGGEQDELRQWMKEESKGFRGSVPPLPQVKPYEPVPYDAMGLIDPFRPSKMLADQKPGGGAACSRT